MDSVFDALADPSRRDLLDRLRTEGPLSVTELAEPLSMSRQGVTKHLDVLLAAGLVQSHRSGRRRLHSLTANPLRVVASWLAPYEAEWDRRLDRLKAFVEAEDLISPEGPGDSE